MEVKKELLLEGLHCAGCAAKIEDKVKNIEGVKHSFINFASSTLTIEVDDKDLDNIIEQTKEIISFIEPGTKVIDKDTLNCSIDNEKNCSCASCGHSHGHKENSNVKHRKIIQIIFGIIILTAGIIIKNQNIKVTLYLISYVLVGIEILLVSIKNILRGELFDENFLMSIATIGAIVVSEYPEAVAVMLFYQIGELLQDIAVNRSRKSITALINIKPEYANLVVRDGYAKKVSPDKVNIGDSIIVKPGEKVPLDGEIINGFSSVDTSLLTGESIPRDVQVGDKVLSGFINKNGVITVKVTKTFKESAVSKILDLVENAASKKAKTENFITKFAKYYTPIVVFSAIAIAIIPPIVMRKYDFSNWIYRASVFLVVSCPCALVISIPLGFFSGIGACSKKGILVKGGNFLEGLNNVSTVVFDKTGTLTKGEFSVKCVKPYKDVTIDELIEYTAYVEFYSNHPIAKSIIKSYKNPIDESKIENYKELPGNGVQAFIDGVKVSSGNIKFMKQLGIECDDIDYNTGSVIYTAIDNKYGGYILISDNIKEDSKKTIEGLKQMGIKNTVMLTGDRKSNATSVSKQIGIEKVYSELLPGDKVEKLELLKNKNQGNLVFIGDGINDAPVLARADIGVAMGAMGSDAAIEAADVVIMNDEPSKIVKAIKVAKYTRKIVMQNIIFTLGVKFIVLTLATFGITQMWMAIFADVGVALVAVINSSRILKI